MRATLSLVILMLALAGCVENMADLKDRLEPAAVLEQDPTVAPVVANESPTARPPVARVTIFGANGALLYKSTFTAPDVTDLVFIESGENLTLIAADSEAIEPGAKLVAIAWTVDGSTLTGAKAAATLTKPGIYPLVLTVTDGNGQSDSQRIPLAVAPKPFDVTTELMTGPLAGAQSTGQDSKLPFALDSTQAGVPALVQAVVIKATPPVSCDVTLGLFDPDGKAVKEVDDGGATAADQTESITTGALVDGAYSIVVTPFACAEPRGIPVLVTVTFLEIVPGITDGGDAHGGHAGH